jgi:hypothetical protein
MTKDHTQLAIENGAKGLNRGIVYFEEIAEFNATIEAAIKQAFDEAEVVGYSIYWNNAENIFTSDDKDIEIAKECNFLMKPLIAKRIDK